MPELPAVELSDIATGASDNTTTATIHLRSILDRPPYRTPTLAGVDDPPGGAAIQSVCSASSLNEEEPGNAAGLFRVVEGTEGANYPSEPLPTGSTGEGSTPS